MRFWRAVRNQKRRSDMSEWIIVLIVVVVAFVNRLESINIKFKRQPKLSQEDRPRQLKD